MKAMPTTTFGQKKRAAPFVSLALCAFLLLAACQGAFADPLFAEPTDRFVEDGDLVFDYGNATKGYLMIKCTSKNAPAMKIQINCDGAIQTYDLSGGGVYEAIPLFMGSGTYKVSVLEKIKGTNYALLSSKTFKNIQLTDENAAFLVPTQYCWYTADTLAVQKSMEICAGLDSPWDKAQTIYNYVVNSVAYDYMKMLTVRNPYVPDIDDTYLTGLGICFDYAALFACMARVQGIPTQLVTGVLLPTGEKHAWNRVLLDGNWMSLDTTFNNQYGANDYTTEYYN